MQEGQDEVKSAMAEVREATDLKDAEPAKATTAEPATAATAEPESKEDSAGKAE
jgi:hypothetical protein